MNKTIDKIGYPHRYNFFMNLIISILTIDTDMYRKSDSTLKGNQILMKARNVFYFLRQQGESL